MAFLSVAFTLILAGLVIARWFLPGGPIEAVAEAPADAPAEA